MNMLYEIKRRILGALKCIDAMINVLVLGGSEDHTISGRVGFKAYTTQKRGWIIAEKIINAIFWFDPNHCYKSIEWDEVS